MPAQVLPNWESFSSFEREMRKLDFRVISIFEFRDRFRRLGLKAPRPRFGSEIGFTFHANGLDVVVWTTWLVKERFARKEDAGWVLISDGDEALYFSHPIHRTKNFFKNLYRHAWIARWRALHRPLCPECRGYMRIARGRAIKSRYWSCRERSRHQGRLIVRLDWDFGIPPRARKFLEALRKMRQSQFLSQRREGRAANVAPLRRKPWEIRRAENRIVSGR